MAPRSRFRFTFAALIVLLLSLPLFVSSVTIDNSQAPFLQAIQGSWGINISGWTKGGPCEKALGLTCSASGMVEEISLRNADSSAGFTTQTLPVALFNLTSLTRLRLTHFNIQGSVPEALGNLLHLQVLALYNNNLTGPLPASLTNLDSLSILQMDFNRITSPLPELAPTMEHLYVTPHSPHAHARTHPNFHLSPSFASALLLLLLTMMVVVVVVVMVTVVFMVMLLVSMRIQLRMERGACVFWPHVSTCPHASVHGNIHIHIHTRIRTCSTLSSTCSFMSSHFNSTALHMRAWHHHPHRTTRTAPLAPPIRGRNLQYNHLTGTMPDWLSKLKGLQNLSLNNNNLTGTLPDGLANLRSLTTLRLHTNELTGTIPTFLGDLRALKDLTLQGNQLSGTIPASLGGLDALKDFKVPEYLACPDNSTWCVVLQTNTTSFCLHCTGFCATCSPEAPPPPPVDHCAGVVCSGNFMVCNADTGTCSRELPPWLVAVIIVGALLAFALLCLLALWLYRRFFSSSSDSSSFTHTFTHTMYPTQRWSFGKSSRVGVGAWAESAGLCREYPLKLVLKATNNWSQDNLLGSGGYGDVYRGVSPLDGCTPWAVKRAKVLTNDFQKEVLQMSSKNHPHLVRLLGFAMGGNVRSKIEQVLIYELMPHGDLHKWMGQDAVAPLTLQQRLDILIGAARGLEYLHSFGIMHRDIKPGNILLDADMQANVSDFGLVKLGEGEQSVQSTRVLGTPGYVDPAYANTKKATTAADVYSFGILTLVVMSGREATFMEGKHEQHILSWVQTRVTENKMECIGDPAMEAPHEVVMHVVQLALSQGHCLASDNGAHCSGIGGNTGVGSGRGKQQGI